MMIKQGCKESLKLKNVIVLHVVFIIFCKKTEKQRITKNVAL